MAQDSTEAGRRERLAARKAGLSSTKRDLLAARLKRLKSRDALKSTIPRRTDRDVYPLSFAQERLWFLDQLDPGSPVYNRPLALNLKGSLQITLLEQVLTEIIRRHENLRANFTNQSGQAVQTIHLPQALQLSLVKLDSLPPAAQERQAHALAQEEAQRPFDLVQDSLLRGTLLRFNSETYILLLVVHHIVFDKWSANVFIHEMSVIYQALVDGARPSLPELSIQYADFAAWQRQWLAGERLSDMVSYWREQLANSPPELALPTDYLRPTRQNHKGAHQSLKLSADLLLSLNNFSRSEGVTLFMTLLAAFNVLLFRYTGQTDIVVGSPVAGRGQVETERLIGFFVNTLVLRTDLSGHPTFRELLSRVRNLALGAYSHQELPFEKLVEALQPARNLDRPPFFQVMFNLENIPTQPAPLQDLNITEYEFDSGVAQLDLTLEIMEDDGELRCEMTYDTDLFEATTISRLLEQYQILLTEIITQPDIPVSQVPTLTEVDQHQLFVAWLGTRTDEAVKDCIHHLFERQAAKNPDDVAVRCEDGYLTYRELNQKANQVAHYLMKHGVKPDTLVAVCLERSLEMVVAVLGVLKAGGAYVPLDPEYPQAQLAFILEDTQALILLTQQRQLEHLPSSKAQLVCLDRDWDEIAVGVEKGIKNPVNLVTAENLAYVIYTSGSTGEPKGVMVEHRALVNFTRAAQAEYAIAAHDRVLQFASISFDASAEEIYPCLTKGATLVLRPDEMLISATTFWQYCGDLGITVLDLPTAYWHHLICEATTTAVEFPTSLRLVIIGGEQAQSGLLALWFRQAPDSIRLVNSYGPTEGTVVATMCDLSAEAATRNIPIGAPIRNVETYVLNEYLQPAPIGAAGELYLGGSGLARGYLNRPDLTLERFIPHPFADSSGERLYKTGDLVRYRSDGNLEFLGRIDRQVKIRGFRIELGGIEMILNQHPAVHQNTVIVREHEAMGKQLVAYIVPGQFPGPAIDTLRRFLSQSLPEYMLPSAFVMLDSLPLTPNGKINQQALPAPDIGRPEFVGTFIAPQTPTEKKLADIWSQELGLDQVGTQDNFFALGGHSLLATQLMSRINHSLNVMLPLRYLFEYPTIAQLAKKVVRVENVQSETGAIDRSLNPIPRLPRNSAKRV